MIESFSSIFSQTDDENFDPHQCFSHYSNFLPPGLGNPGNLCFLNSLLQTFAGSDQWKAFFDRCPQEIPLIKELTKIVNELRDPFSKTTISTKQPRKMLKKLGIYVNPMIQQDMHEFYTCLIDIITSLLNQKTTSPISAFATLRFFPTHCVFEETMTCPICNSVVSRVDQTSTFIIDINHSSLHDALMDYFGPITIESKCSHCNRMTNRTQKRTILFMPRSILFFINRNIGLGVPSRQPVSFPLTLDVNQYSMVGLKQNPPKPPLMKGSLYGLSGISPETDCFHLTSVTAFRGKDNAGHYFTYRVHKEETGLCMTKWVCASDSSVSTVTINDVLNSKNDCILLHYELPLE